ncbi:MAG: TonB-dependent receptor [Cytophagales bacterium]|nr:MAG: TonB-dependent receptor [Cytophagales bacterium]
MNHPYRFVGAALLLLLTLTASRFIDDSFVNTVVEKLSAYNQQLPREKVYVQTDRDLYVPGETIWLKGYLFEGIGHGIDSASRVLYIDLIDAQTSKPVAQVKLKAMQGQAPGQIALPDSLGTGTYLLQAYTGWMRNFGPDYYFTKTLTLLRADEAPERPAEVSLKPDVQFLPESGQLITGMNSRVAFKAINALGKSMDLQGFVLDNKNDTVVGFTSQHLGMGFFAITPEAGQTYTAFARATGSQEWFKYPMPAIQSSGVVLTVDNMSNPNNVKVFVQHTKPPTTAGVVTLVAQTRGIVVHAAQAPLTKKAFQIQLPRDKFPDGIAQLTLFDEQNKPVAERLIFVDRKDRLTVKIAPEKASYKPREAVTVDVTVTDPAGQPVETTLSLAITDGKLAPTFEPNPASLVSHLLLSSDLVGTIEQPGGYFDETNTNRAQNLDLLMMTQGWRRFTWNDVLSGTIPQPTYVVEDGLLLSGQVMRANKKPAENVNLTFMLLKKDSTRAMLMGQADEKGRFMASELEFYDSTGVFVQALSPKGGTRDYTITLDQLIKPAVRIVKAPYNPLILGPDALADFLKRTNEYLEIERQIRRNQEVMLNAVTVKAKREKPRDTRRMMYSEPDRSVKFDPMNTGGALTFLDVIRSRVPGVQVTGSGFEARVQIRAAANFQGAIEPAFFLDGSPVSKDAVLSIPVSDIDAVDVLTGGGATIMAGSNGAGGVINVLTKRGSPDFDPATAPPTPGTLATRMVGFARLREFYAPRYDQPKPEHIRPDYRATLHWSPMLKTGPDGKAKATFYASDARTKLRLIAEGATLTGKAGSGRGEVTVE